MCKVEAERYLNTVEQDMRRLADGMPTPEMRAAMLGRADDIAELRRAALEYEAKNPPPGGADAATLPPAGRGSGDPD